MKTSRLLAIVLAAPFLATAGYAASPNGVDSSTPTSTPTLWNQAAAAHYLDSRETWWQGWSVSQRDHKTVCVSCHSVLPYALSRSSLRGPLGEEAASGPEHIMLNNVLRRVTLWNQVEPFYHTGVDGPNKSPEDVYKRQCWRSSSMMPSCWRRSPGTTRRARPFRGRWWNA